MVLRCPHCNRICLLLEFYEEHQILHALQKKRAEAKSLGKKNGESIPVLETILCEEEIGVDEKDSDVENEVDPLAVDQPGVKDNNNLESMNNQYDMHHPPLIDSPSTPNMHLEYVQSVIPSTPDMHLECVQSVGPSAPDMHLECAQSVSPSSRNMHLECVQSVGPSAPDMHLECAQSVDPSSPDTHLECVQSVSPSASDMHLECAQSVSPSSPDTHLECVQSVSPSSPNLVQPYCPGVSTIYLECIHCHRVFSSQSKLLIHLFTHFLSMSCTETYCNCSFSNAGEHALHLLTHTTSINGERIIGVFFKCTCAGYFYEKNTFSQHCVTSHGRGRYLVCFICEAKFARILPYQKHILVHIGKSVSVCHICGKFFEEEKALNDHFSHHAASIEGIEVLQCFHCGICFTEKIKLHSHIYLLHNGQKPHYCDKCSASFYNQETLRQHIAICHHEGRELTCFTCKIKFAVISNYQAHVVTHIGKSICDCFKCEQLFEDVGSLKKHFFEHVALSKIIRKEVLQCFDCAICFTEKLKLLYHIYRLHNGKEPNFCELCLEIYYKDAPDFDVHHKYCSARQQQNALPAS